MKAVGFITLLTALGATATAAQAQVLQPGLWELTTSNMEVEGKPLPDLQMLLGQLQNLPAEQRAMMEQVLAKQGITVGGKGIRSCLTPEQVKTNDIPLQDPQSGCTQRITERNGNVWKFSFSCPKAQGAGTATFIGDREFNTQVAGTFNTNGASQKGSMQTHAKWLGADCGTVKPRQ
jgi:hypothetical protein